MPIMQQVQERRWSDVSSALPAETNWSGSDQPNPCIATRGNVGIPLFLYLHQYCDALNAMSTK
jgi:hypothetical protein